MARLTKSVYFNAEKDKEILSYIGTKNINLSGFLKQKLKEEMQGAVPVSLAQIENLLRGQIREAEKEKPSAEFKNDVLSCL